MLYDIIHADYLVTNLSPARFRPCLTTRTALRTVKLTVWTATTLTPIVSRTVPTFRRSGQTRHTTVQIPTNGTSLPSSLPSRSPPHSNRVPLEYIRYEYATGLFLNLIQLTFCSNLSVYLIDHTDVVDCGFQAQFQNVMTRAGHWSKLLIWILGRREVSLTSRVTASPDLHIFLLHCPTYIFSVLRTCKVQHDLSVMFHTSFDITVNIGVQKFELYPFNVITIIQYWMW